MLHHLPCLPMGPFVTSPPEHQADLAWDLGRGVATPGLPFQAVRAAVEYLNM